MPKTFSGKQVVKILCKYYGFSFASQKGSHIKLQKILPMRTITTIVPMHRELARGTFKGILDLAEVDEKDFFKNI